MRRQLKRAQRVLREAIGKERLRAIACLLLLAGLLASSVPLWMVVVLPLLVYAGGWLAVESGSPRRNPVRIPLLTRRQSPYACCRRIADEQRPMAELADDRDISATLKRILAVTDRSLDVLAEEGRQAEAVRLLKLVQTTSLLMGAYLRLLRRGFGSAQARSRILEDLATIELAIDNAWFQINRDALVRLETLSATLDLTIGLQRP
jgi:hypothetical protein